ncbi:MAG: transcription antitermination factor NusB [Planctomycetota bacterium]
MTASVRAVALRILESVGDGRSRRFAVEIIDEVDRRDSLSPRDRRFLTELVLGVLRHLRTLDTLIAGYSRVKVGELHPRVRGALRIALYQIVYLDGIPPHAAVSESVNLVRRKPHHRAFVNAVLRHLLREMKKVDLAEDRGGASPRRRLEVHGRRVCFFPRDVFADPERERIAHLGQVYSQPDWLVWRWQKRYGEAQLLQLFEESNARPSTHLRVNGRRASRAEVLERLQHEGVPAVEGDGPLCIEVQGPTSALLRSRTFKKGLVTVQGAAAQKVVPLLDPRAGESVLEIGAAPGAKATHLAEHMGGSGGGSGLIVAVDRDLLRLARVREACGRLGHTSIRCVAADGRQLPFFSLEGRFDAVLVDAPCSNTAVLARRPEARWRLGPESLEALAELQLALLLAAAPVLRPGGRLCYSTCSLEPEENAGLIERFRGERSDFEVLSEELETPSAGRGDGGYRCLLRRSPERPVEGTS